MKEQNLQSGFVAGTLVYTDKGLVPIQDIKVGDMVLSRPENDPNAPNEYKRVVRVFRSIQEKQIFLLRYVDNYIPPSEDDFFLPTMNLPGMVSSKIHAEVLTSNHPFWINENISTEHKSGWEIAANLIDGDQLLFSDGSIGGVISVVPLMETHIENVFYLLTDGDFVSMIVDTRDNELKIYYIAHLVLEAYKSEFLPEDHWPLADHIVVGDIEKHPFLKEIVIYLENPQYHFACIEVFNIEVEDFHTYFVGELGLWVHD